MMKKIFGLIVCLVALATTPVFAGLDEGRDAYLDGDYVTALREWQPLAEQGNLVAQFNIGQMYRKGHGVPQDYQEARKWYKLSAEQGFARAQYNLGGVYYYGHGVPQDYKEAVKWFRLSAEQGDADAQNNLGGMYYYGHGIPQDYIRSYMWAIIGISNGGENSAEAKDLIAEKITPEQIAEAQKLARECLKKNYKGC